MSVHLFSCWTVWRQRRARLPDNGAVVLRQQSRSPAGTLCSPSPMTSTTHIVCHLRPGHDFWRTVSLHDVNGTKMLDKGVPQVPINSETVWKHLFSNRCSLQWKSDYVQQEQEHNHSLTDHWPLWLCVSFTFWPLVFRWSSPEKTSLSTSQEISLRISCEKEVMPNLPVWLYLSGRKRRPSSSRHRPPLCSRQTYSMCLCAGVKCSSSCWLAWHRFL